METLIERLCHPAILTTFFIFGLPVLMWGIKSSITGTAKYRIMEAEINLRRELVAQGRSAEEIERIMGTHHRPKDTDC